MGNSCTKFGRDVSPVEGIIEAEEVRIWVRQPPVAQILGHLCQRGYDNLFDIMSQVSVVEQDAVTSRYPSHIRNRVVVSFPAMCSA
jgi:hypothetical protein